ncbi:hypothetical protein KM043_010883 [Ampulex compressa]|nr:hypothetical protein KM043_010883 [Ampulex compressa]
MGVRALRHRSPLIALKSVSPQSSSSVRRQQHGTWPIRCNFTAPPVQFALSICHNFSLDRYMNYGAEGEGERGARGCWSGLGSGRYTIGQMQRGKPRREPTAGRRGEESRRKIKGSKEGGGRRGDVEARIAPCEERTMKTNE